MTNYDLIHLSEYERQEWDRIQRWRHNQSSRRSRIPAPIRDRSKQLGGIAAKGWKAVPGTAQLDEIVGKVLAGGNEALTDAVAASLFRDRILQAARDAGADVSDLSDLRTLDLRVIDHILPSLNLRYALTSAATGAGSGFVAGGGTTAIVGTGGVAAAPGGLAVGGALAGDVVATIGLAARVVTHYAGYYGYDTREEDEKAVLLAVIGVGVAGEGAAKQAALLHVRQVSMMIARRATWRELGEEAIVKLIQGLFAKLSVRLTQRKLAQALPIAGIAAGAGLNYTLMRKVGTAASFMYRERFLIEKYGLDVDEPTPDLADVIDVNAADELAAIDTPMDDPDR
ncbi:MAG: EcsC family protein [Ilumatobacter sp.]|uniref:EcsC family protein n=1 Tax=Ilumatobacter sp. TaxID=1967498 RepID=UPI0032981431